VDGSVVRAHQHAAGARNQPAYELAVETPTIRRVAVAFDESAKAI
jgi:hypothetical protein